MVYGFALQSGGKLDMRSVKNHGTTVELFLPRAAVAARATPRRAEPFRAPASGGRVLVCDDDIEVLACMTESLADYGYDCVAVTSGDAVLTALGGEPGFDAMILDFAMPDMSGIAAAEQVRRRHPGLPILLVTGYMDSGDLGDGGPKLPTLRKPFMPADLASEVAKLITARRAATAASLAS
jgi:CheY-like chemotaxis protein